jgi:hypothetical protein
MKYPIVKEANADTTFQDLNISLDTKENVTKSMTYTIDKISSRKMMISQTKKLDEISGCNVIDPSNEILETTINSQDSIRTNSINFYENPGTRMENATTIDTHLIDKHNREFHDNIYETKSVNSNIEKNANHSVNFMQEKSLKACNMINEIKIKNTQNAEKEIKSTVIKKQNQETLNSRKNKIYSSTKPSLMEITKCDVKGWSLSNKFNFVRDSIKRDDACASNNKDDSNDKKMTSKNTIGSVDVSHQYFIEKEIKNIEHDILTIDQTNSQATIKNVNEDVIPNIIKTAKNTFIQEKYSSDIFNLKVKENDEQHLKTLLNDDNQSQNNTYNKLYKVRKQKDKETERKTIPNDKILRSSNITDLVMEGLMFTIKQDKDSVAVIEQKTKLEVDEVLENSEKVETKAGEKCLLNSSLLRLENLVTMIDSPQEKQNKTDHINDNSAHLLPLHIFPSCAVYNLNDTNHADKNLDVFNYNRQDKMNHLTNPIPYRSQWHQRVSYDINDNTSLSTNGNLLKKSKRLMQWQDSDNKQKKIDKNQVKTNKNIYEEKEKEDIPENLPSLIFSEGANAKLQNTNLLLNNMKDIKQMSKYRSFEQKCSDSIEMHTKEISAISNEQNLQNVSIKPKLNIPRIVSDKLITIERMPSTLQKVLHYKYKTRRFTSATISSEASQQQDEKIQHLKTKDVISESSISSLEDKRVNFDIADKSIKVIVDPKETKCDKNESDLKVNNLKINTSETDDWPTYVKNAKGGNSSKTHHFSRRNSMLKHNSPRKLQDITEDFYYDLMQHTHNKSNTIQQRCLRQRRRSLDNPDNIKKDKVRIEMLKFIQDITEGVRVVVKRLDMDNKSNLLKKNSTLSTYTHM